MTRSRNRSDGVLLRLARTCFVRANPCKSFPDVQIKVYKENMNVRTYVSRCIKIWRMKGNGEFSIYEHFRFQMYMVSFAMKELKESLNWALRISNVHDEFCNEEVERVIEWGTSYFKCTY